MKYNVTNLQNSHVFFWTEYNLQDLNYTQDLNYEKIFEHDFCGSGIKN